MTSPLGSAMEKAARLRLAQGTPRIEMDMASTNKFADLPLKPLSATKTTHLVTVVQYIEGAKYPMPKLQKVAEAYARGDFITIGVQSGLWKIG